MTPSISWWLLALEMTLGLLMTVDQGVTIVYRHFLPAISLIASAVLIGTGWAILHDRLLRLRAACSILADFFLTLGQFFAMIQSGCLLEYAPIVYARHRPYLDDAFIRFDSLLGYDWRRFSTYVAQHPALHQVLLGCYTSLGAQSFLAILFNALLNNPRLNRIYFWAAAMCSLSSYAIAFLLPSLGFPHIQGPRYETAMAMLRQGGWSVYDPAEAIGLIAFPSLHAMMAVVLIAVSLHRPWLAAIVVPLDIGLLVATGPIGGHHLADTLAGVVVALLILPLARKLADREAWSPARRLACVN